MGNKALNRLGRSWGLAQSILYVQIARLEKSVQFFFYHQEKEMGGQVNAVCWEKRGF